MKVKLNSLRLSVLDMVYCKHLYIRIGLGVVPGERSFFQENGRIYQEQNHRSEKRTECIERGFKILERLVKERNGTERKLL